MNNQSNNAENACGGFGKPSQGVLTMAFVNPQPFEQAILCPTLLAAEHFSPTLTSPF